MKLRTTMARGGWTAMAISMAILAVAVSAFATRMVPLSPEQLAAQAGVVVHGRVLSLETTRDEAGRVFTRTEVQVLELWKGRLASGVVEVVAGGGVLGDRSVSVAGQAVYEVGEEVVAYLVPNPGGEWVTLGLAQGRFAVHRDARTGERTVSNVFWGDPAPGGAVEATSRASIAAGHRPRLTLEELRRRTREVVR